MTETMIRHCAPTLAGIKTGNLVNCPKEEAAAWMENARYILAQFGVQMAKLHQCEERALMYLYQPSMLKADMRDEQRAHFLQSLGYVPSDINRSIDRLQSRFLASDGFPHEVGLFLGYPLADVLGFIEHEGKGYKCCGYWKVYGDEKKAKRMFSQYRTCTRALVNSYQRGVSFESLIVAQG